MPPDPLPIGRRLYRGLLRLLPFEIRAEFGADIEQTFSDQQAEIRTRRSPAQTLHFWLRTAADISRTAPGQHWDILKQDVRVGTRQLMRAPGFAGAAILTLALGVAGSTGIFSIVHAVVLRPLAFPQSERVVRVGWLPEGQPTSAAMSPVSSTELQAMREAAAGFDLIGGMTADWLSSADGPLHVKVPSGVRFIGVGDAFKGPLMASASIFEIFGVATVLGRLPDEQDEQPDATPVAVLGYSTWTSLYGQDPEVIGRTLIRSLWDGRQKAVTIVGVLAHDAFAYGNGFEEVPAWSSLDPDVVRVHNGSGPDRVSLSLYGRLAPGVALESVRAQLDALTLPLASSLPERLRTRNASLRAVQLRDQLVERVRTPLLTFLGAVSCLMLLAAVNVASLVLARALSRRQEFAARFALGARPLRVARQLFTESAILAGCGGVLGVALAWFGVQAFVVISPAMPRLNDSGLSAPALAFAYGVVVLAACVAALVPALQATRRSVLGDLRRAGGAPAPSTVFSTPLAALAGTEIALVLVLLAGTGLLVNSFVRLVLFDIGIDTRSIVMVTIDRSVEPAASAAAGDRVSTQSTAAASAEPQRLRRAIDEEVIRRVRLVPGVAAAGLTGDDPFGPPYRYGVDLQIGDSPASITVALRVASPTALDALGMRIVAGRWFTEGEHEGMPPIAVVNHAMAQRFWNGTSPVGTRIVYGRRDLQVVGVVADVRERGARQDVPATLYLSTAQFAPETVGLVLRTRPGAAGVESAVAAELAPMGNRISAGPPRRLEEIWWSRLADDRFPTSLLMVFSLTALAVAVVGVHGVLRFIVAQRTREMGIRKALGATGADLAALVFRQVFRFVLPGCLAGLMAAVAAGPLLESLLFGISPMDPLTLVVAGAVLLGAVVAGAYWPARRAAAVDAAVSLRTE